MISLRSAARVVVPLVLVGLLAGESRLPKPKPEPASYYTEAARQAARPVGTGESRPVKRRSKKLPVILGIAAAGALAGALVAIHDSGGKGNSTLPLTATPGTPSIAGPK